MWSVSSADKTLHINKEEFYRYKGTAYDVLEIAFTRAAPLLINCLWDVYLI